MSTGSSNGPTPASGTNSTIDGMLSAIPALNGIKTYLAAAGLAGLALYQAATSDFAASYTSLMGALAAVGLRHAISKSAPEATPVMPRSATLFRAFCHWFGPVADSLRGQLNDTEKVKVLVKFISTYGLSRAALEAAAHDADFLTSWVVPVAPAVFAGAWEALSRWQQGAEHPPSRTNLPSAPSS